MPSLLARLCLRWRVPVVFLVCLSPTAGAAQDLEAAKTSRLTGVPLPAGAQRVLKKEFTAHAVQTLEALAKQLRKECTNPEVLLWNGANKPATEDAVKAVAEQMEKAGYECKVLNAPEGLPPVLKKLLVAKNRKQAVLGFWAAADEMVTLAWGQVDKYEEKPAESGGPAAAGPDVPDKMPAFPKVEPKPGCVRGTALSMAGHPLAGAEITIRGTTMAGERTWFSAKTDAKGHYELPLPAGVYRLSMGTYETTYNGLLYKLDLRTAGASDDTVVAANGHVGNWVLQVRGPIPNSGSDLMYGGYFQVQIADGKRAKDVGWAPGSIVLVVLTPVGPLVDGSSGRTIATKYEVPQPSLFDTDMLFSIPGVPVGRYSVSAQLIEPGKGPRPLDATVTVLREGVGDDTFPSGAKALYIHPKGNHEVPVNAGRITVRG